MALSIGDPAPDFSAEAHNGQLVKLSDYKGQQAVVLFFYPMNGTSVCTAEACAFRDAQEEFAGLGAALIGISGDSLGSHRNFAQSHRLSYKLVSDADGKIRKAYGISNFLGLVPQRVTFVIDKQGIVRHKFSALLSSDKHVQEAIAIVKQLSAS